jgi:RimJ/RimL family protein N-acetyltransferase
MLYEGIKKSGQAVDQKVQVEIRLIQEADIPSFREALGAVAKEKRFLAFTEVPPIESTRDFVVSNIREGIPQYVAIAENKVVGWCDICRNTSRPVFSHIGHLGMGVIAEYRGQGLGRSLITAAIDHAKKIGLSRIELEVYTSNQAAIKLYKSLGVQLEGTKRQHARFDDRFEDSHIMALIFD